MADLDEFVYRPVAPPPSRWWGLAFAEPEQERAYRTWRDEHVRPFTRFAMISATLGAACAWVAVIFGALVELRGLTMALITVEVCLLVAGAYVASHHPRYLVAWSSLVNLSGGLLALLLTVPLQNITATAGCVALVAYFGLTMYRLSPLRSLLSVGPYVVGCIVVAVWWHQRGVVNANEMVLGIFIAGTTLLTGMVVNLAMEWLTRQSYLDHVLIQEQREALFEERANIARFLAPEVAEAIRVRGIRAIVRTEMVSLTAVCIDLRGFTAYTHAHGASTMAEVLREYYEVVIDSAREFGATVSHFAGDGAMALVGAPIQRADHTRAGLELGREMLRRVREVTERHSVTATPLGAGVGIASGECAVGPIGSLSQLHYTAVGHAVNLSSRLCDVARDGQILMAAGTARALEDEPHWRRQSFSLPGIADPVEVTVESTTAASVTPLTREARPR